MSKVFNYFSFRNPLNNLSMLSIIVFISEIFANVGHRKKYYSSRFGPGITPTQTNLNSSSVSRDHGIRKESGTP